MNKMKTHTLIASVVLLAVLGCSSGQHSPMPYTAQTARQGDVGEVFDRAKAELVSRGYEIARSDRETGVLSTSPIWVTPDHSLSPKRISISRLSTARKIVEIRVIPTTDGVNVYCKVAVQQNATEAHRMALADHSASDSPAVTPIDQDGATTIDQNAVWQTLYRDRAAERSIVTAIVGS